MSRRLAELILDIEIKPDKLRVIAEGVILYGIKDRVIIFFDEILLVPVVGYSALNYREKIFVLQDLGQHVTYPSYIKAKEVAEKGLRRFDDLELNFFFN
jgi:hypothetical protein